MQEPATPIAEPVLPVRRDQLDLQRAALRSFLGLSSEIAEVESARLDKEWATRTGAMGQGYDILLARLEEKAGVETGRARQSAGQSVQQAREFHEAQLAALDAEYRKRCQRVIDETESSLKDAHKKLEQDLWLADSVAEATRAEIRRETEKLDKTAPSLTKRLEVVSERAGWVLGQLRYAPPAGGGSGPGQTDEDQDPTQAMQELYDRSVDLLEQLERLSVPRLVVGFTPIGLGLVLCGMLLAVAGIAAYAAPGTVSFGWLGPVAGAAGIITWLFGWRSLGRLAQKQMRAMADPLYAALDRGREAVEQHLTRQRDRLGAREQQLDEKRTSEISRAQQQHDENITGLEQRRAAALQKLQDTYVRAQADFRQQRDAQLQQVEQQGRDTVAEVERQFQGRTARLNARRDRELARLRDGQDLARKELEDRWRAGVGCINELIGQAARLNVLTPPWEDPAWPAWKPVAAFNPTIRFGDWSIDLMRLARCVRARTGFALPPSVLDHAGAAVRPLQLPALLELPDRCSLLLQTGSEGRDQALGALQATMARLLTCLPAGRAHFIIIDPVGLGENFAGFMHLADYDEALVGGRIWTEKTHIEQRLGDLTTHMETVIQKYLRNEFETIDAYNVQAGELAEPYRFLVIADFPANFTEEAVHRLTSIVSSGPRCGVYTLIAHDMRLPLPPGFQLGDLQLGSVHVRNTDGRFYWQDEVLRRFPLALDAPPDQELLTGLMHKVGQAAGRAKRVEVPFDFITPTPDQFWTASSREEIRVPVGRTGAVRLQELRLGRGVAQHTLIAGKTGSGKSTLLHVLITNLVLWYSPDEVEFYLIDFKKGVEFKTYATHELPHARAIAIESDREFGLSVLHRLDGEMERRGEMFRRAGVQDLPSYRQATGAKLPRTLLVVDEFQVFFSEDDKIAQDAAILLDRLVRQGRAFGIHVILGSQTLGGTSGLARSTIGQMAVRIALQCSEVDSQLILDDGNSAARLLSRPGEAIYNDAGGLLQGNSPFQTAWLADEGRDVHLDRVVETTRERGLVVPAPIVFEGNAPADLRRNPLLGDLLQAGAWPAEPAAVRLWLGEAVAIKDPTAAVLRRQSGANLLLIGQRDDAALAIMTSAMIGLAAQHGPAGAEFVVFDGSATDSPQAFQRLAATLPHPSRMPDYRAVSETLAELADELHRRQGESGTRPPAIYVVIYGLQRYRMLRKSDDSFSFSYGGSDEDKPPAPEKLFAELLREGPNVGIHAIGWADTPATVERMFDRQTLREFDNRVLFQMSAQDSSNLIDSPVANRLGFYRALFFSEEQGLLEKFRPYSLPDRAFLDELAALFARRPR